MKSNDKQDRLTAILALSADQSQRLDTECLSPEDVALVVESKLTGDERQRWLEHLSLCDSCYQEWRLLKEHRSAHKKNIIIPIFKRVSYRHVGSTLALAATIAVFINIYEPPLPETSPTETDKATLSEMGSREQEIAADSVKEVENVSPEEFLEQKSAPRPLQKSIIKDTCASNVPKARGTNAYTNPPAPLLDRELQSAGSVDVQTTAKRRAKTEKLSVQDEIFERIRTGCAKEEYDPKFWIAAQRLSRQLNMSIEKGQQRDNLSRLQQILSTMDETNWKNRCEEMTGLLAQEEKSRYE